MKLKHIHKNNYLLFAVIFAVIGVAILAISFAATNTANIQPELASLQGTALQVSDSSASNGAAVQFSSSQSGSGQITAASLTSIRSQKIFFGHQSVGGNIMQGVSEVYAAYGVAAPRSISSGAIAGASGGFFSDDYVGQNSYPLLKNSDFDSIIRGGAGNNLNIAFFKYCYVDITSGSNTTDLFNQYKALMSALVRDYPNVKFLYVTNPLTTYTPADNVARERFNQLIRQEYAGTGRLFDLATIESTDPSGNRITGTSGGSTYYALYDGYSSDGGHLNTAGRQVAARALLSLILSVMNQ